jgi:hypothetical protein
VPPENPIGLNSLTSAPPATRNDQTIREAAARIACRPPILDFIAGIDFFTVPAATFRILYVFIVQACFERL